jgi:Spy/CpxP family protein refolding chaperone
MGQDITCAPREVLGDRRAPAWQDAGISLGRTRPDIPVRGFLYKKTRMDRTAWKMVALAFVCTLALVPRGMAQQDLSARPHPPGTVLAADRHADDDDEDEEHEHGSMGHRGRMGHEGMRHEGMQFQQHLGWLTRQLKLTDAQRAQVQTILRAQAKEMIRLHAERAAMRLDVQPMLEADPVDLAKVKQHFLAIAAKEVDLHMAHVTAMQEIRKILTPEQQQQFKAMHDRMRHEGGRRESHDRREHRERD